MYDALEQTLVYCCAIELDGQPMGTILREVRYALLGGACGEDFRDYGVSYCGILAFSQEEWESLKLLCTCYAHEIRLDSRDGYLFIEQCDTADPLFQEVMCQIS